MKYPYIIICLISSMLFSYQVSARTKLVALPDRESTLVRLDHPVYTLVQEERRPRPSRSPAASSPRASRWRSGHPS